MAGSDNLYNFENYINETLEINQKASIYSDVLESTIREKIPEILDILLMDRTTSTIRKNRNIIWANDNYLKYGPKQYGAKNQILPELITGKRGFIIMPRSLKNKELQKSRTRTRAEVFTPTWVVKMQNDEVDDSFKSDDLETYVKRKWLEITCGEAPYMTTRYDMETGELIPLLERVGFVDRKLRRVNKEVTDKAEWQRLVEHAYKSSYGFEWNGDSLLLARENLLFTYIDFYLNKWNDEPSIGLLKDIAEIISFNVFQMDGLKYIIPLSEKREKVKGIQISLFDDEPEEEWIIKPGRRVKIMNWDKNRMEFFDKGVV